MANARQPVVNPEKLPDEVVLPVCEACGNVGKQPESGKMSSFCVGPRDDQHKRQRMKPWRFGSLGPVDA